MKTILTVIGARPQIIKATAISRAIKENFSSYIKEILLHTGQHYDAAMSQIFIDQLGLPVPDINLKVGSDNHGQQTASMLAGIEEQLLIHQPDGVIVYGDTNSTLAAALAAAKIQVPVIHIEAGLRSFNKQMPEEINRIGTDHVSTLLFCPTSTGIDNLRNENFKLEMTPPFTIDHPAVFNSGDVMFDNSIYFSEIADRESTVIDELKLENKKFILCTIHRPSNTDDSERLNVLMRTLLDISEQYQLDVVFPVHPRTQGKLDEFFNGDVLMNRLEESQNVHMISPCGFLDMIALEKNCCMVMTDSGGVQKEAFFFNKPSLIFRAQTEWVEIIDAGCALLVDANSERIKNGFSHFWDKDDLDFPEIFGNGKAANFICEQLVEHL